MNLFFLISLLEKAIIIVALMVISYISISLLFVRSYVTLDKYESVYFVKNSGVIILLIPCFLLLVFLILKIAGKISDKHIFIVFSIVYLMLSLYLITHVDQNLRADARVLFNSAYEFNHKNYESLKPGNYVAIYPHQLGFISFERLMIHIYNSPKIIFLVNALSAIGINFFQWKITDILFSKNENISKISIILSFLFLPQLFFILFAYGLILGLFLFYCCLYFTFKFFKTRKGVYAIISIFPLIASYFIKNNFLIGIIAIMVINLFFILRSKETISGLLLLLIPIIFIFSNSLLNHTYERSSGYKIENSMPKSLFVAMGLQDDQNASVYPGWYNGYTRKVLSSVNFNSKKADVIGKEEITERIKYFKENPAYTFAFFKGKITSTWNDPMFQSVWSGPLESTQQYTHSRILKEIYNGKRMYGLLTMFMNVYMVVMLGGACISFFISIKKEQNSIFFIYVLFCSTFFIGGFLFHLMWETKSQYVYPYLTTLIPCCSFLLSKIVSFSSSKLKAN
ncbi:hypothetical protein [Enterococcus sp. DIV0756]|uniref:hypothetical protein n=1 Tax=Enterococcus sp. DIV0756 TaxID=2774636 RepID=UPI003F22B7C9